MPNTALNTLTEACDLMDVERRICLSCDPDALDDGEPHWEADAKNVIAYGRTPDEAAGKVMKLAREFARLEKAGKDPWQVMKEPVE